MNIFTKTLGFLSITIALLGFIPWFFLSLKKPELQPLFTWIIWMIICIANSYNCYKKKEPWVIWLAWAIGDLLIIITTIKSGGINWQFEQNIPLFVLSMLTLFLSFKLKGTKIVEGLCAFSLGIAYFIIIREYYYQPKIEFFYIIPSICGFTSALYNSLKYILESYKVFKSIKLSITSVAVIFFNIFVVYFMAT
jgi:hypothetical protein